MGWRLLVVRGKKEGRRSNKPSLHSYVLADKGRHVIKGDIPLEPDYGRAKRKGAGMPTCFMSEKKKKE